MTKRPGSRSKQPCGNYWEQASLDYLLAKGLTLLERNYRCRFGEIDLIMQHRQTRVFVEVRYRKNALYGGGAASVDRGKQQRLMLTASHYLQNKGYHGDCRFDVMDVSRYSNPYTSNEKTKNIRGVKHEHTRTDLHYNWIQSAFTL